jgi:O-antigen/teichoic acid export membrane protein
MLEDSILLPDESLATKLKKKWIRIYVLSFIVMPCSYIIKIIVSNELSVGDIGLMYSILGFVGILSVYNDLWLTDALQYYIPKYIVAKNFKKLTWIVYVVVLFQLGSGLLLGGAMFLGAEWLALHYFSSTAVVSILQFFGIYFLLLNIFQAMQSFYFGLQHVKVEKSIELLRMLLVALFTIWAWQASILSLQTFARAWLLWLVGALCVSLFLFKKYYYHKFLTWSYEITKKDLYAWLSYGFWSLLGANAWTIISQIDLQIILLFSGKEAAGYWTNYLSITSLLIFTFVPILAFTFPVFTELIEKKRFWELHKARHWLLWWIVLYWLLVWVIAQTYGAEIVTQIFGDKYIITWQILVYSAWVLCTPLLGVLNFQYIRSFWKIRQVAIMQMVVLLLHVIVSATIMLYTKNYFTIAIILHLSHLLFYCVTEWYIQKNLPKALAHS